jgi:adenylate kinase family enzyme
MKTCTKCKIEKPFEDFYKQSTTKDGHTTACKECIKARKKELKKSPLMQLERQVKSSIILENKLLAREGKKLCTKCKDIFLIEDITTWGRCKNCNKEYWLTNKDKILEHQKEYKEKNKENIKERRREYKEKNKNKIKEYQRQYCLKKKLEKENQTDDLISLKTKE